MAAHFHLSDGRQYPTTRLLCGTAWVMGSLTHHFEY